MPTPPIRRGATLAVLCAMALMIVLDSTIVAVAVPSIQQDLGFSPAGVAWVANAYVVAFAGLLLLAGRLGDLLGAWRVFLAGLVLFTVASLACGLANTAELLVVGRFIQGAGGASAAAVILGTIVRIYPEPAGQARAMGIYSFTQAGGAAAGFVIGGVLTDAVGWPAIFLINAPIGVAVLIAGLRVLPRDGGLGLRGGVDLPGAALVTAGLSAGVYAVIATDPLAGIGALLLIGGFLARQRWARQPLIPLSLLTRPWLLRTNAAVVLIFATGFGFQFVTALYVQRVMGFDALRTGLAFLPTPITIGIVSLLIAPRLTARHGPRRVLLGGLTLLAGGLLLLSRAPVRPSYPADLLPALVIMGLGVGVVVPSIIMLSMAGAGPRDSGMVSGFTNTAQQAGAALGLAVLAAVAANHTSTRTAAGISPTESLRDGYSLAFLVAAAFVITALLITALLLRHPPTTPSAGVAGGGPAGAAAPAIDVAEALSTEGGCSPAGRSTVSCGPAAGRADA